MEARELLARVQGGGFALGSFNAVNLETAQAIVQGAEAEDAPVVLAVSHNAARYGGLNELAAIGRALRERARVPVLLHFDHAESADVAFRAVDLGFDSVMLETSSGSNEDDVRAFCDEAHARGALCEIEYEIVAKGDRHGDRRGGPADVAAFVERVGCDLVAVSLGTEHKQTEKSATLDFPRLRALSHAVSVPLVLHGSSGVPHEELAVAAREGIGKVNLATELMLAFTRGARKRLEDTEVYDPRVYLATAREAMVERVRMLSRVLGSSGRARD